MKHVWNLCAIVCMLGLVAACASGGSESATTSSSAENVTKTVSTVKGDVTIPTNPKRVVLLNYALAGYVYDLGLPITAMVTEHTDASSEPYPAWKADFEKNGTTFMAWPSAGFNIEAVVAQKPDLIIGGGVGFPYKQINDAYGKLTAIAPTLVVSDKDDTWQKQFEFLAKSFDKPQVYRDAVAKYDARVQEVRRNITPPPSPAAFLSISRGRAFGLVEGRGLPAEFAKLGIESAPIFASGKFKPYTTNGDSFEIPAEQLASTVTQPTVFVIGFLDSKATSVDKLRAQPVYASLRAFAGGHAYDLPYWVQRPDFDRAIDTLGVVEQMFRKK